MQNNSYISNSSKNYNEICNKFRNKLINSIDLRFQGDFQLDLL